MLSGMCVVLFFESSPTFSRSSFRPSAMCTCVSGHIRLSDSPETIARDNMPPETFRALNPFCTRMRVA
jgi:hypothetical protein